MRIAVVCDPKLYDDLHIKKLAVQIRDRRCDVVVFYGQLFRFMHAIDIALIKLFQEVLDALGDSHRIIFSECCVFVPTATCIFARSAAHGDFSLVAGDLHYCGKKLRPGIHDGTDYWPFVSAEEERIIYLRDNDIGSLPDISGAIEVRHDGCDQFALDFARQKYAGNARFVDLAIPVDDEIEAPTWNIELLQWKDVYCYECGSIDFAAAGAVTSIIGKNGSGKSSIVQIMLLGLFAKRRQRVVRRGATHGHVRCVLRYSGVRYTIDTVITASEISRTVTPPSELEFLPPPDALYCSGEGALQRIHWNVARANGFLRAICDLSVDVHGHSRAALAECSAGQRALIELAVRITANCAKQQVFLIDEVLDKLDDRHFTRFLEQITRFYKQVFIIGHRRELLDFSDSYVVQNRRLFISKHGGSTGIAFECAYSVGSSRVDLQACKLEYSIVSPK